MTLRFILAHAKLVGLYLIAQLPEGRNMFADDHFDIFDTDDQHGSTADYWAAYDAVLAEAFVVDADEVPFLLTDEELDAMSEDIDNYTSDADVDLPDWFAPSDAERPF